MCGLAKSQLPSGGAGFSPRGDLSPPIDLARNLQNLRASPKNPPLKLPHPHIPEPHLRMRSILEPAMILQQ